MKGKKEANRDYIEAFNQGYELAKELGLKSDILKDIASGNRRMEAMKDGMEQFGKEVILEKDKHKEDKKDIVPPFNVDNFDNRSISMSGNDKEPTKDLDQDVSFP